MARSFSASAASNSGQPKPPKLPRKPASALAERYTTVDGFDVFYRESADRTRTPV